MRHLKVNSDVQFTITITLRNGSGFNNCTVLHYPLFDLFPQTSVVFQKCSPQSSRILITADFPCEQYLKTNIDIGNTKTKRQDVSLQEAY